MTLTAVSPWEAAERLAAAPAGLRLVAQPIVDVASGGIAGYELLSRFPQHWNVSPCAVFAAAEERGMSGILTREVLRQAVALRDELPHSTFLTVNCSPGDLADPATCELLRDLDLDRMFVELTEVAWPGEEDTVFRAVDVVRASGGRIAADDVGAGYAGLLQLIRLRPELVKIDREIVRRIPNDVAANALVEMLGTLAGRLDAWIVAEGVETRVQLSSLMQLGIPLVQGYYLGRPAEPWTRIDHASELVGLMVESMNPGALIAHQRPAMPNELELGPHGEVIGIRVGMHGPVRPLVMSPTTPVADAVERAMARPDPLSRVAPIVVTDDHGEVTGVVTVESLVRAITQQGSASE